MEVDVAPELRAEVPADADGAESGTGGSADDGPGGGEGTPATVSFGPRDAALLRAVDEAGSLNAAASSLGRSYARAHSRLTDLEAAFGPLVERTRGGADGGGSELTEGARDLLARLARLRTALSGVAGAAECVLDGEVRARDGELATVTTAVGPLRALVPAGAERVQLSLRADAVTLHAPDDAPPAGGTSARNRLAGRVASVDHGESVATVRVAIPTDGAADSSGPDTEGAGVELIALVTTDSVDRLGLAPGAEVVATFKATATRATPLD